MTTSAKGISDIQDLIDEMGESLESLEPDTGVERYLRSQRSEVTDKTIEEYARKLDYFLEFCSQEQIEDLNGLNGRQVDSYRMWRRDESTDAVDSLGRKTLRDDMYLFRSFLKYMESIEAVKSGLSESVEIPELESGDGVRNLELPRERAVEILEYLRKYEYASQEHVVWLIHCHTGRRPGGLHSLDLEDFHSETDEPYLRFVHRGGSTRLKNGEKGEGLVNLPEEAGEVITDYVQSARHDVTDDDGREPLLTSSYGRLSKSTMRKYFYKWTRPCKVGEECPHSRDLDDCTAATSVDSASKCPSSHPPYSVRHGYLSQMRREGIPVNVLSERCDVSEQMLEKHYDERTEDEKRQLRRKLFDEIETQGGGYL